MYAGRTTKRPSKTSPVRIGCSVVSHVTNTMIPTMMVPTSTAALAISFNELELEQVVRVQEPLSVLLLKID